MNFVLVDRQEVQTVAEVQVRQGVTHYKQDAVAESA